ncbi:MAG: MoaD/ThiS family protein [Proteobacteria bacterium]|nr:MoaD/ThiS family protein [Pseudomonadota bacterium]
MNDVNIKLHYLGLVKNTVGCAEEEIVLPEGSRLIDAFNALDKKYGEQFTSVILKANGRLRPSAKVLVDEQDIRDGDGLDTKLEGKPQVSITVGMYPIAGG